MITDLRKLRHVVGVAEAGSFTAAGATLAISQSALTKSVAEVEHLLDVKLFHRLPRGVALTDAGELFVRRARRILADTEDLMGDVASLRELRTGRLRIGVAPAAFISLIDSAVAAFAQVYPGIQLEVLETEVDQVPRLLADGALDIAAGESNYLAAWSELETETLAPLHPCVIARPDHPTRARADLTLQELLGYPIVLPTNRFPTEVELTEVYVQAGLSPQPSHYRCNSVDLVRRIVQGTDAIAPLLTLRRPGSELKRTFHVIEGIMPLREHVLGLALLRRSEPSPPVNAFRDIFRSFRSSSM